MANSIHDTIRRNFAQQAEQRNAQKLIDACAGTTESGQLIRGFVTKKKCFCGNMRWDDGTACVGCKRTFNGLLDSEDEERV